MLAFHQFEGINRFDELVVIGPEQDILDRMFFQPWIGWHHGGIAFEVGPKRRSECISGCGGAEHERCFATGSFDSENRAWGHWIWSLEFGVEKFRGKSAAGTADLAIRSIRGGGSNRGVGYKKMKKLSIVAKERRSSVGFFDFVKFRGFLDGGVDRKVAKVAKGRKEEGVSEGGVSEFRSFGVSEFRSFGGRIFSGDDARAGMRLLFEKFQPQMKVNVRRWKRGGRGRIFGVSEFQSCLFISFHLRESCLSAVKKSKCAAQEEGVSEDGFSERWIQLN